MASSSPQEPAAAGAVFLGLDVGTGSARAGVFTAAGRMLAAASRPIQMWRPQAEFVEQSSDDIWRSVCEATREALAQAGITDAARVRGVGFDATCSLVALDADGRPVSVSPTGADAQNVIVWMDHRAVEQAARINATGHEVLRYVGGVISPEMESPKLLWLKENLPAAWSRAAFFFDLPDFLTYRATDDAGRSLCSLVCKWTYLGHEPAEHADSVGRWSRSYWETIGLGDLAAEGFRRLGTRVRPMGAPVGNGLSERAAGELGLRAGTPVGASMIDAHAGGIGVLGGLRAGETLTPESLETRLALVGGTSSCHLAVSREALFVDGVWGPYFSALVPGLWLTEGGQSATGALIDHVVFTHAAAAGAKEAAGQAGISVYEFLNRRLDALTAEKGVEFPAALTRELHVEPDFHGNRSPRADPTLRGMISGLKLSADLDDLARLYLATVQAVAYGTRDIVESLNAKGYRIRTLLACGGGTKNPVFLREHADATGCAVVLPREPEAVLLGAAMLGAVAAGAFPAILDAMAAMSGVGAVIEPAGGAVRRFHDAKYAVFQKLYEDQLSYRQLMAAASDRPPGGVVAPELPDERTEHPIPAARTH